MATELRRWLQKHPHPATVVGFDAEDEERVVKIGVLRSKWRDAENALAGCWKLEARAADESILRVFETEPKPGAPKTANNELVELAKLLNAAHDAGAARHEAAYRMGFEMLAGLVKTIAERLNGIERAYHRQILADAREQVGPEASADDLLRQVLMLAAAQHLGSAGANGKAPSEGEESV